MNKLHKTETPGFGPMQDDGLAEVIRWQLKRLALGVMTAIVIVTALFILACRVYGEEPVVIIEPEFGRTTVITIPAEYITSAGRSLVSSVSIIFEGQTTEPLSIDCFYETSRTVIVVQDGGR